MTPGHVLRSAPPEPDLIPATRSRGRATSVLAASVAIVSGLAVGLDPSAALLVGGAMTSAVVLLPRLEWAALAVVSTAVFEDYLDRLHPWSWDWLVVVLVLAWVVRRSAGSVPSRRAPSLVVPLVAFTVVLALATAVHPNGAVGLTVGLRYAELAVVALVLVDCFGGVLTPYRAARAYVLACTAAALCGLVTAVVADPHRVSGPLGSPDDLAFFLVGALPLCGTVTRSRGRRIWPMWACFAVLVLGVIGTQSRGAYAALVVLAVLAVPTGVLRVRYAGMLLAVIATAAAFVLALLPHPVGSALNDQQRYAETRLSQSVDLWAAAAHMTQDHPALGLGPGAFALFHVDYRRPDPDPGLADRDLDTAHSTVLHASAELGVLGALALYATFLAPVGAALRRWLRDRSRLTAGAGLALSGVLVTSGFESEQFQLPLWFLAALTAALAHRPSRRLLSFEEWESGPAVSVASPPSRPRSASRAPRPTAAGTGGRLDKG